MESLTKDDLIGIEIAIQSRISELEENDIAYGPKEENKQLIELNRQLLIKVTKIRYS